ncbi:MAG: homocysteine S-methyltransferase family protein [Chloroflexota bacterium]|nr:homocysteine S-methyltransferase family protein [Chloroflexota bacterium]
MAKTLPELLTQKTPILGDGARIVGGCCGTTPQHIAAVREARSSSRSTLARRQMIG